MKYRIVTEFKVCTKCGIEYALTEEYFSRNRRSKDGFSGRCKNCQTEYYWQNRDKIKVYSREYYKAHKKPKHHVNRQRRKLS